MKLNEHEALFTHSILLVPYSPHHVPTYHIWMQDPDLQTATASEPLTLPEEYAMQKSWRTDADKLTFIVCTAPQSPPAPSRIQPELHDAPESMFGDVNLFLYDDDDDDEEEGERVQGLVGEVEIMVAKQEMQGKGLGREVLETFLWYVVSSVEDLVGEYHQVNGRGKSRSQLRYLRVKIGHENIRSIRLFESLGFQKESEEPNYFGELELRWHTNASSRGDIEARRGSAPVRVGYGP